MYKLKLLLAKWRNFWGFCPECNSDAPEMYDCVVCENDNRFPPAKSVKIARMIRFEIKHKK